VVGNGIVPPLFPSLEKISPSETASNWLQLGLWWPLTHFQCSWLRY